MAPASTQDNDLGNSDDEKGALVDAAFYRQISDIMASARQRAYSAANFAMVQAYWHIGESIVEKQGGSERAGYGTKLIKELSERMTEDFGKGFAPTNLRAVEHSPT